MELWYKEYHTPGVAFCLKVKETLFSGRSSYQDIQVIDTWEFGRILLLDGLVMISQRDEFIYHEMMAHPAMCLHPTANRCLVIGGGDGGTVREITRHDRLSSVTLCEIDSQVIEISKRFFPEVASALGHDPRVEIVVDDGVRYVDQHRDTFDCIFVDSTDPVGPAEALFQEDFFRKCHAALKADGILVAQSESPTYHLDLMGRVRRALLSTGFTHVYFYFAPVPSYPGSVWSWVMASKRYHPTRDLGTLRGHAWSKDLRYYNLKIHKASFAMPEYVRQAIAGPIDCTTRDET